MNLKTFRKMFATENFKVAVYMGEDSFDEVYRVSVKEFCESESLEYDNRKIIMVYTYSDVDEDCQDVQEFLDNLIIAIRVEDVIEEDGPCSIEEFKEIVEMCVYEGIPWKIVNKIRNCIKLTKMEQKELDEYFEQKLGGIYLSVCDNLELSILLKEYTPEDLCQYSERIMFELSPVDDFM
ncbi:MAG: hypothetical protein ACLRZ9_02405 [Eubacterium sp.]